MVEQNWKEGNYKQVTFQGHKQAVVGFKNKGERLLSCGFDNTVRMWNNQTGEPLLVLKGHTHYVKSVMFIEDNKALSCSYDKVFFLLF